MAGDRDPGWAHDPDATIIMPAVTTSAAETTMDLPALIAEAAPSGKSPTAPPPLPTGGSNTGVSVARHGSIMALGSIVSRLTGFLRTAAIGAAIGVLAIGNDYNLANTLPGMVYELLLGGVLASVVVPLLVRARTRDADQGEAYTQRLLTLASLFLAGATVIAVLCAPLFSALLTNSMTRGPDRELITTLSYLLLPMIFFYGMAALFAAILNTRGHFATPTFTPILNNLIVIAMTLAFLLLPVADVNDATTLTGLQVAILGLGTTLGIVVQATGLWPALRRVGFRWRWRWDFRELHLRELGRVSAWMLVYVIVSQIGVVVVLKLAQMAADSEDQAAGPAIFNNAFLIFMMAHGIIAVSIITALMPRMAAAAAENRHEDLIHHLSVGTRLTAVVLVPATVAYVVLGRPLAVTLFEFGNYGHAEAIATGWVIAVAGLGLVPFAISQLQLFAFYAMPDTKTPALLNLPVVAVRITIDLLLYLLLIPAWIAAGLMFGNAVSFVLAAAIGYWLLRRRVGPLGLTNVFSTIGRLAVAALIAAVPTVLLVLVMNHFVGDGKGASLVTLILGAAVLLAVYVGAATALRIPEIRDLTTMVRSRISRSA